MRRPLLGPDTRLRRHPDVAWRILGENLIAITPRDNKVHRFNATGTFIWSRLEEGALTPKELEAALREAFAPPHEGARRQVLEFLAAVEDKGLIQRA